MARADEFSHDHRSGLQAPFLSFFFSFFFLFRMRGFCCQTCFNCSMDCVGPAIPQPYTVRKPACKAIRISFCMYLFFHSFLFINFLMLFLCSFSPFRLFLFALSFFLFFSFIYLFVFIFRLLRRCGCWEAWGMVMAARRRPLSSGCRMRTTRMPATPRSPPSCRRRHSHSA